MDKEAVKYVKDLGMPVSEKYLRSIIMAHPDYPSIVSLADAFGLLGIDCAVAQKPVDEIAGVQFPFLLHAEPNHIKYVRDAADLDKAKRTYSALSGIVIKIDKTDIITDPVHNKEYARERMIRTSLITMSFAFAALVLIPVFINVTLMSVLLALTALAGVAIVVMLKIREYGLSWERLEAFCQTGPNADCDSVISSTGAKLFGVFSLLNIALSYFIWQLIVLSSATAFGTVNLLAIDLAAIASVAVVAYSVFYQWRRVGKWCKFCLLLGFVSLVQVAVVLALDSARIGLSIIQSGDLLSFAALFLLFLILITAFTMVSMIEEKEMDLGESEIYHKRIFNSPRVFFDQLKNEPAIAPKSSGVDIIIGNPESGVTLTAILNLLCKPCRDAFDQLQDFVSVHGNSVRIVIRLTAGSPMRQGDLSADQYLIRYWMTHIRGTKDEEVKAFEMLSVWYRSMDLRSFSKAYNEPSTISMDVVNNFIGENQEWIAENPVKETPTFFFNDKKIPRAYRIKEMTSLFSLILTEIDVTGVQESEVFDQIEV